MEDVGVAGQVVADPAGGERLGSALAGRLGLLLVGEGVADEIQVAGHGVANDLVDEKRPGEVEAGAELGVALTVGHEGSEAELEGFLVLADHEDAGAQEEDDDEDHGELEEAEADAQGRVEGLAGDVAAKGGPLAARLHVAAGGVGGHVQALLFLAAWGWRGGGCGAGLLAVGARFLRRIGRFPWRGSPLRPG